MFKAFALLVLLSLVWSKTVVPVSYYTIQNDCSDSSNFVVDSFQTGPHNIFVRAGTSEVFNATNLNAMVYKANNNDCSTQASFYEISDDSEYYCVQLLKPSCFDVPIQITPNNGCEQLTCLNENCPIAYNLGLNQSNVRNCALGTNYTITFCASQN